MSNPGLTIRSRTDSLGCQKISYADRDGQPGKAESLADVTKWPVSHLKEQLDTGGSTKELFRVCHSNEERKV